MRNNSIHPLPVKWINKMTLYDVPFGKVFDGCDTELKFEPPVKSCPVSAMRSSIVKHKPSDSQLILLQKCLLLKLRRIFRLL